MQISRQAIVLIMLGLWLISAHSGCQGFRKRAIWHEPCIVTSRDNRCSDGNSGSVISAAEAAYAHANRLDQLGQAACIDAYYQAAVLAWPEMRSQPGPTAPPSGRSCEIYHSSLVQLVRQGQRYGRFNPRQGLRIETDAGPRMIPVRFHGFPWSPADFDRLIPVGHYRAKDLDNIYRCAGLGSCMVVEHHRTDQEWFRRDRQVFAATLVLRPDLSRDHQAVAGRHASVNEKSLFAPRTSRKSTDPNDRGAIIDTQPCFVLDLFDPLRISTIEDGDRELRLATDISSPIAFILANEKRDYLAEFVKPGSTTDTNGLFMIEPYQPGKIPLVFVHGLLSDRLAWTNVANEIRANPELNSRFQIWGFEYSTGEPFLRSASVLRSQIRQAQAWLDPDGNDPALSRIMLVGHSMGGLVSKLQVTYSEEALWNSVSKCPIENIRTSAETRASLSESFFFDPSPSVTRVVYMGVPHQGSPWAHRPISRLGSWLVDEPAAMEARHQQLISDNPGNFSREFRRRIPTSLDLLRADSKLLQAMDCLQTNDRVKFHSVIGSFRPMLVGGASDGVVPIRSARKAGVESEQIVRGRHQAIHKEQQSIRELVRIMNQHWQESAAELPTR